jgi:hypothetical protein
MFTICVSTRFHIPGSNGQLFRAIKMIDKYRFHAVILVCYELQKWICFFSQDLLPQWKCDGDVMSRLNKVAHELTIPSGCDLWVRDVRKWKQAKIMSERPRTVMLCAHSWIRIVSNQPCFTNMEGSYCRLKLNDTSFHLHLHVYRFINAYLIETQRKVLLRPLLC